MAAIRGGHPQEALARTACLEPPDPGLKTMIFWAFLLKRYRMWRVYRETFEQLATLDERTLRDINIGRNDIETISRRAAHNAVAA